MVVEDDDGTVEGEPHQQLRLKQKLMIIVLVQHQLTCHDAVDIVCNGELNYPGSRLPRVHCQPVSLFNDAKAEEMAFPVWCQWFTNSL